MRICIIGAGASGMAAATMAARTNPRACIVMLEKLNKTGSKILASGNGKCNISNSRCENVLETLKFFESIGVLIKSDESGRMYPYSEAAIDVRDALENSARALGVEIRTGKSVVGIRCLNARPGADADGAAGKCAGAFELVLSDNTKLTADRVLIAAGGKAGPQYGTSGDSYTLLKSLGHTISKLSPVLTSLDVKEDTVKLKGVRAKAVVNLYRKNPDKGGIMDMLASEEGEVQFTESGLSGICIFNLSRFVVLSEEYSFGDYRIEIDLVKDIATKELTELLESRKQMGFEKKDILQSIVDRKLAEYILSLSEIRVNENAGKKGDFGYSAEKLAECLKHLSFTVGGAGGWKSAQCTRGGVKLCEVDPQSFESKLVKGLFISGEALDFDGPCGGFNLENAWESGIAAGRAMASGCGR